MSSDPSRKLGKLTRYYKIKKKKKKSKWHRLVVVVGGALETRHLANIVVINEEERGAYIKGFIVKCVKDHREERTMGLVMSVADVIPI